MLVDYPCWLLPGMIPDIYCFLFQQHTFLIAAARPLEVLGSAVLGGERQTARYIFNHTVDKDYASPHPERDLALLARDMGVGEQAVGLMTAVDVRHTVTQLEKHGDLVVAVFATVGVGNLCSAGVAAPWPPRAGDQHGSLSNRQAAGPVTVSSPKRWGRVKSCGQDGSGRYYSPGTINLIVLVDGNLSRPAMVNAVITATEAKVLALQQAGLRLPDGRPATGTTTDALVIACTGRGPLLPYAGAATTVGRMIGQAVHRAVEEGIAIYQEKYS
ncbi:MAG: adenosylcobinamide amidohydrolase [Desulfurispora sp.]|uniref:adenosylcobinamide amidohydrolase n=1 Tax=Desulfurispora sp. TaxID=3014275 RepID=UPI00404A57C4